MKYGRVLLYLLTILLYWLRLVPVKCKTQHTATRTTNNCIIIGLVPSACSHNQVAIYSVFILRKMGFAYVIFGGPVQCWKAKLINGRAYVV